MSGAAVLWTGGKDCCLALHEAAASGIDVTHLVTFVPAEPRFLAHPLAAMELHALALQLPHVLVQIDAPYEAGYARAFAHLRDELSVDTIVTGDIDLIAGHEGCVRGLAERAGLAVVMPLWQQARLRLLRRLLEHGIQVVFSCVRAPHFASDWLGRTLDPAAIDALQQIAPRTGLDLCGENGEYHTLALDAPRFARPLAIRKSTARVAGELSYLELELELEQRGAGAARA